MTLFIIYFKLQKRYSCENSNFSYQWLSYSDPRYKLFLNSCSEIFPPELQEQAIKNQKEIIEDYEKQIQELKEAHRTESEQHSCDEKDKWEKFRSREKELESELSSIKSTYEDELLELRKCCQDTLQEQVNLAKADALNSLQQQIQVRKILLIIRSVKVHNVHILHYRPLISPIEEL